MLSLEAIFPVSNELRLNVEGCIIRVVCVAYHMVVGPLTDRAKLCEFFDATGGKKRWACGTNHWRKRRGWKTKEWLGSWYGVTVNADNLVEKLELRWNGCRGVCVPYLTLPAHSNAHAYTDTAVSKQLNPCCSTACKSVLLAALHRDLQPR